jgi:3-hydroxyisobutyrate dehydrogenase-like beta-hydroxyacid dehydrogenase
MLDAPVSGGSSGATYGTLSMMVGGPFDLYEEMLPLLQLLARDIAHVGQNGCGQVVKGVNQLVMGLADAVFMEALAYGMAYGVGPATIAEALKNSYASRVSFINIAQTAAKNRLSYSNVKIHDLRRFVPDALAKGLTLPAATAALKAVNTAPQIEDPLGVLWPTWPPGGARPSYWEAIWNGSAPKVSNE